jgi:hypothetical protein
MFASARNRYQIAFHAEKADKHIHGYHKYYDQVVGDSTITSALEIGVFEGASLKAWKRIWPNAIIEGMDNVARYDESLKNEFKIHEMSSTDNVIDKEYDIIIDDGDHHWLTQLATFKNYYDKAKKFYVIEDVMGIHAYDRLIKYLPKDALEISQTFTSKGRKVKFSVSDITDGTLDYIDHYRYIIFDKR